jgi:hypothetical protein
LKLLINGKKKQFQLYNIYFHDDDYAVDTLFYDNGNYWYNIFPQLKDIMYSCVKFGSAMRIDIWRILILYRYGGTYLLVTVTVTVLIYHEYLET